MHKSQECIRASDMCGQVLNPQFNLITRVILSGGGIQSERSIITAALSLSDTCQEPKQSGGSPSLKIAVYSIKSGFPLLKRSNCRVFSFRIYVEHQCLDVS